MTAISSAQRRKLVEWVKESLTGEKLHDNILHGDNPLNRYTTGILYPLNTEAESEESVDDMLTADEDDKTAESVTRKTRYQPPTSMGFSFYVEHTNTPIYLSFGAAAFSKEKRQGNTHIWSKHNLTDKHDDYDGLKVDLQNSSFHEVLRGRAILTVTVRAHDGATGNIITVTLRNLREAAGSDGGSTTDRIAQNSLFETKLMCSLPATIVKDYPRVKYALLSEEEQELELRYQDERAYAIGHGVAVDWRNNGQSLEIFSDFMPIVEVPQVTANTGSSSPVLSFVYLKTLAHDSSVCDKLEDFIEKYEDWIDSQELLASKENTDGKIVAERLLERMTQAKVRMFQGVELLRNNDEAQRAFSLANEAMLMQMELNGRAAAASPYAWRPFQLAFVLMSLESCANTDSEFRYCVDLIWFPTGGGKTEAYLGLAAFMFIYRRLTHPSSGAGTAAIMRYTLRLLTSQQFIRACKVISALEIIRRGSTDLGETPFSVGMWLGGATSPNTYKKSFEACNYGNFSKLVLDHCPWCQIKFNRDNYVATEDHFAFKCHNTQCELGCGGKRDLPFNVVDEALYKEPPTLLIATVDKFARLPWEERAGSFLGGFNQLPPELIIQDELHLISGALGSIVGMYEVGIETILNSRDVYPKFIASTATVREAKKQIKALFARDMAVFPPVGLRHNDSYFAKEVPLTEKPGRLYVGYMAFGKKRVDSAVDLAAALANAPTACFADKQELLDAWWTQLVYHGSLKGVGNSRTNFNSGVPRVQQRLALKELYNAINDDGIASVEQLNNENIIKGDSFIEGKNKRMLDNEFGATQRYRELFPIRKLTHIKSLTSQQSAEENSNTFNKLKTKHPAPDAIDTVLATNMVSVGLDEPRLALMVINGQPLTTAEYIQASSRVGRGTTPGIVYVNYYKTQAKSLSHYENFRAYHKAFYRYVEPSSITPFTQQVRNRALHAAFVCAIRHGESGLLKNTDAADFDASSKLVKSTLKKMLIRIDLALTGSKEENKKTYEACEAHLNTIINQWEDEIENRDNLRYQVSDKSCENLLIDIEKQNSEKGLWPTLNSMRNVEKTGLYKITEWNKKQ